MSAPLIGMSFLSFLVVLILSAIVAAVLHWVFRYRLFSGIDGFLGQWMVAWLGAWLGPAVLGHWFDSLYCGTSIFCRLSLRPLRALLAAP
jgi:hypothetical protein